MLSQRRCSASSDFLLDLSGSPLTDIMPKVSSARRKTIQIPFSGVTDRRNLVGVRGCTQRSRRHIDSKGNRMEG
jgi:hypothetical protein